MEIERVCFVSLPLYGFFDTSAYERTGGGGAKRQLALLSTHLQERFALHAVVGDYGQPRLEHREGVVLHRAYEPGAPSGPVKFYKLFRAMRRADADVYVYRGHPRKAAAVYVAATLLNRRWVYNVSNDSNVGYNYNRCSWLTKWLFRRGLSHAHAVITQTEYQQRRLDERFGTASTVVPNGYPVREEAGRKVDESHDDEQSSNGIAVPETSDGYVLWVGRIEREQKRPHLLLDCAERLPDLNFTLVGPRADEAYADRIASRCRDLPNVEYVGSVPPDGIQTYYTDAVALVNTSAHEGFPNTFLEAWREGTPVVSYEVDPGRYLDQMSFTGYVDGDIDTLVDILKRLATDSEYRRTVGSELRAHFERTYRIEVVAERYGDALAEGT